ncbi:MAG: hypothetical protein J6B45_05675 [Clostridia bacterium]|nr:hypothetical protein [Clostridia bacterium]
MKNTKRILLFTLALIALTLVMSLSIFAEETADPATCDHPVDAYDWNIVGCSKCGTLAVLDEGSTNVSSNLGYTIYFATTLNDLSNTNYDVIRLMNNISLPSGGKITNPNAIIDLGGNVLYRNGGWLGLRIVSAKGFVNGYVYKTNGGSQVIAVTSLEFMEDVTLAANSTSANNATGLIMNTAGAYLGSMKNVTICAGVLNDLNGNNFDFVNVGTNGIYNHGIEATQGTIGSMENVKISTYGQAITSAAKIGTMTNCVFSGDNIALNITTLQSEMEFVNCEIHSKNLAIYIADAAESTEEAPVSFELENTKIVTNGAVYALSDNTKDMEMFAGLTSAVALVNGQLYTSLEDAVNALKASTEEVTTFALIGDLAVDSTIVIDKKVNFSFGGATYNVPVYGTNQVVETTVSGYTVTSSVDVVFSVVEGGYLTISGAGVLKGTENAIVADGGEVVITAGTYEGYNPRDYVAGSSCVVNTDGVYTIAGEHDYDDEVGADKTTYQVDGVCNICGYVRGVAAVDYVYYATLEEAFAVAIANGKQVVLAADIVLDGDVVWDLTGATFNFNGLTVTVNGSLSIVGGTFTQDVSEYVSDEYCTYKNNKNLYVVIDAHTWTDATCTAPKTCSACGATEGEALGHSYFYPCDKVCQVCFEESNPEATHTIVHVEAVAATCTENGNIEYWYCSDCGYAWADEALTQQTNQMSVVVPATGHSYFYACDVRCEVCGEETNPEATHTLVHVEAVAATCTENGNVEYWYCSDCGSAWADEACTQVTNQRSVIVPASHAWYVSEYQPATCIAAGYEIYACENCDETYTEELAIDANAHTPNYSLPMDSKDANCQEDGYFKYTCFYCEQEVTETTPADPYAHNNVTIEYVAPTCQSAGYETYECSVCGETGRYDYEASEYAHAWDEGTEIPGGYRYVCELCGEISEEITKGTANDPIVAVTGDNNLVYYATGEDFVVYSYAVSDAGTITVTTVEGARIYVGYNVMGWYYGEGSTSGSYTFEADSAGEYMILISTDSEAYTIPETFNVSFVEKAYPTLNVGDNSISIEEIGGSVEYVVNVAGDYVLTLGENASAYIVYGPYSSEMVESGYEFTVAEGEKVKFAIGTADFQVGTVVVTLESKNAHVHTEEIIPAVPGELRTPGMTSGVKCSECGEILVAPVTADADFRFAAVSLALAENIGITYKVQVPAGYENVYVVFNMNGNETVVSEYEIEASTGRYIFVFDGIRLSYMADLVTATVYAEKDGVISANSYSNYSVKTYIVNQLNKATSSATLKTMLSDLLILGAKTQIYQNYNKDNLMTADVEDILTPSTYAGVPADAFVQAMIVNDEDTRAIADWKSVSLTFTDAMALQFKLAIDPNELENIEIKVTVPVFNGTDRVETYTAEDFTYSASEDRYILLVENIKASQYGQTVVGDIYHNGVQISRTVNYSVNSYIQKNQDNTNVALRDFLRAAYLYGESVFAYAYPNAE